MKRHVLIGLLMILVMVPMVSALYFDLDFPFIHFDDPNNISYDYIYEEKYEPVYVVMNNTVTVPAVYTEKNDSWSQAYDHYYEWVEYSHDKVVQDEIKGVEIRGKTYEGNFHVADNTLYEWSIPIGDRNMEEFGYCLSHELEKGVCRATTLTDL